MQEEKPFIEVRGTAKEEEQRSRKTIEQEMVTQRETGPFHLRPRNKVTIEAGSRSSRGEMQAQGDQSGPEENDVRGPARTTRVDTTGSSPKTRIPKSRRRSPGTDDSVVKSKTKSKLQTARSPGDERNTSE
ncbi:hypothetical protein TNIN_41611 [Trichonephila inaurata madagascariensis]|uniref:Uncharacterized protein n=1 Tax=Trichonephila inaurata madagascariensis TaxID=2747483 RepID=A0A8X6J2J5_9ARAC|nr:hypothetical protein TNIN_41611 [Trichonephila inaurata madagascariensis]